MSKVLFDLRSLGAARFANTNEQLRLLRPDYLAQYGMVGSAEWWGYLDAGYLSKDIQVGRVVRIGVDPEWGGEDPVVVIATDRRDHAYDHEGWWVDPVIRVGTWIHIERVKVRYQTRTGPVTEIIDILIKTLAAKPAERGE